MNKYIFSDTFRTIKKSIGSYLSIFFIVLLGTGFFAGMQSASPSMKLTAENYYNDSNFADLKLSTYANFTQNDILKINEIDNIENVVGIKTVDALTTIGDETVPIKIISEPKDGFNINKYTVLAQSDISINEENYLKGSIINARYGEIINVGDEIQLEFPAGKNADIFKNHNVKITQKVMSPFVLNEEIGYTNLGTGIVEAIIFIPESEFTFEGYNEILIDVNTLNSSGQYINTYSDSYTEIVTSTLNNIKENLKNVPFVASDRTDVKGYSSFNEDSDRIASIANVFPLFFMIISIMVCNATFSRMVYKERLQIGTLKALGYNNLYISSKYYLYAFLSTIFGSIAGIILGVLILPNVVYTAYSSIYHFPDNINIKFVLFAIFGTIVIYLLFSFAAVFLAIKKDINKNANDLMRPEPPKNGKRVLIEKINFIWSKLSFNQKITIRNVFRYKRRFFITVLGIAGSTALVLAGLGIQNSLSTVVEKQYNEIFKYDAIVMTDTNDESEFSFLENSLLNNNNITDTLGIFQKSYTVNGKTDELYVNMVVPQDDLELQKYIGLRNRKTNNIYNLNETSGVIISEKTANVLGVSENDYISIKLDEDQFIDIKIDHITENYAMHYMYMNSNTYKNVTGQLPKYNGFFVMLDNIPEHEKNSFLTEVTQNEDILSFYLVDDIKKSFEESLANLDIVVIILIIAAAILAFVILYNLNSVNVSDRLRELATIKVLGFYSKEVTEYIYNESLISTIFGIASGLIFGSFLHKFIIKTVEVDLLMFGRNIYFSSFILAAFITIIFSVIINVILHYQLKKINMVEALKSVE